MASHRHHTRSRRTADHEMGAAIPLSFDPIQSGPTRTTATLTPTTLRNINETFLEVPEATLSSGQAQIPHQAGFVPPFIPFQAPVHAHLQPHLHQHQTTTVLAGADVDDDEEIVYTTSNQVVAMNRTSQATPHNAQEDDLNSMDSMDDMSNMSGFSEKTTNSTPPPFLNASGGTSGGNAKTPARRGGRRPNKASNLSPEEQEKRCLRRERNKLAAARCRKRRVDHTNELTDEVDGLEKKRQALQNDIKALQQKKEELEFLLEAHRDHCRLFGRSSSPVDVKPQLQQQMLALAEKIKSEPLEFEGPNSPMNALNANDSSSSTSSLSNGGGGGNATENLLHHNNPLISSVATNNTNRRSLVNAGGSTGGSDGGLMRKPNRPSSLNVPFTLTPSQTLAGVRSTDPGIPIQTPSTGIFNYDSLMDGGTGLTPVAGPLVPTSTGSAAMSQRNPLDLVTPTSEPPKLVNL